MKKNYNALIVRKKGRVFTKSIETCLIDDLPKNDILIRVHFSSVNYKDYMSCDGHPAVTRRFPHTPGIDASGIIEESNSPDFCKGEKVIVVSCAMGMN
ncbi:MAG: alcohol dehydrogenase catalytic domain-containing protein, partial [Colwellia sp.]